MRGEAPTECREETVDRMSTHHLEQDVADSPSTRRCPLQTKVSESEFQLTPIRSFVVSAHEIENRFVDIGAGIAGGV
jgi:hypothetical protein